MITFGSPRSSPCKNQYEIFLHFIREYGNIVVIGRVDAEKYPEIAERCNIQTVPTLIIFRKKREIKRAVGLQSVENIKSLLQLGSPSADKATIS